MPRPGPGRPKLKRVEDEKVADNFGPKSSTTTAAGRGGVVELGQGQKGEESELQVYEEFLKTMDLGQQFADFKSALITGKTKLIQVDSHDDSVSGNQSASTSTVVKDNSDGQLALNGTTVKQGQCSGQEDIIPPLNRDLTRIFNIHLVKDEILKYLDGSALINLSLVNRGIRGVVTSSNDYKKKVNLTVETKYLDFFTTNPNTGPLPDWTAQMTHLTLFCNSTELFFISPEKYLSFARIFPSLSTLIILSDSKPILYPFWTAFINKILSLSPNLKSLSIPYPFLLYPITLHPQICENLEELKFTSSAHDFLISHDEKSETFIENINSLITNNCINLKSFTCQELINIEGEYYTNSHHYEDDAYDKILTIIQRNSASLEKFEFGISKMLANIDFSSDLAEISLPNLKFLELRGVYVRPGDYGSGSDDRRKTGVLAVWKILSNLPQPEQLTTLKLTYTKCPPQLFSFISNKFPQLKSLSLEAAKLNTNSNEDPWSFLQSLTQLEELEITKSYYQNQNNDEFRFGLKISDKFPDYLQNNNLRKLSLKGADQVQASTFIDGIATMVKLKELTLTESTIYLDDLLSICTNLKGLEKLEISYFFADSFNPEFDDYDEGESEIDYQEITAFSSLKYLRELSIDFCSGDLNQMLGSISFPHLRKLTLVGTYVDKDQVENIIGLNGMLKELKIDNLKEVGGNKEDFEIVNERNNLQIEIGFS